MTVQLKKFLPLLAVLAITLLYFFLDARKGGYPQCPSFALSGLRCPGCGSQRALSSLLHLDLADAVHYNLLVLLFLPLLLLAAAAYCYSLLGKRFTPMRVFYSNRLVYAILVLVVLFTVLRNLQGFEWLHTPG